MTPVLFGALAAVVALGAFLSVRKKKGLKEKPESEKKPEKEEVKEEIEEIEEEAEEEIEEEAEDKVVSAPLEPQPVSLRQAEEKAREIIFEAQSCFYGREKSKIRLQLPITHDDNN